MVGQVAVSPIEGSTTTDYVVRNAVLGNCSCVALIPYILYICIALCPGKASCLPVRLAANVHRTFGPGSPTALTNRATGPLTCLFAAIRRRLKRLQLVDFANAWSRTCMYAPGVFEKSALPTTKNPASNIRYAGSC